MNSRRKSRRQRLISSSCRRTRMMTEECSWLSRTGRRMTLSPTRGIVGGMVETAEAVRYSFIKIVMKFTFHPKNFTTFIQKPFSSKPLSSKSVFIQKHIHKNPFSSRTIFIKIRFQPEPHPNLFSSRITFHQKPFS